MTPAIVMGPGSAEGASWVSAIETSSVKAAIYRVSSGLFPEAIHVLFSHLILTRRVSEENAFGPALTRRVSKIDIRVRLCANHA